MTAPSYHIPVLSDWDFGLFRSPGPGLGNLLFPIARALIGAERFGGIFVLPTIRQIKFGPILRNEPDKRIYGDVIRHRRMSDWISRGTALTCPAISEDEVRGNVVKGKRVHYEGLRRYFHDLLGYRDLVRDWVIANGRLKGEAPDYDIAVHIRLGDFAVGSAGDSGQSVRQPLEWYGNALELARETVGKVQPRILVFTDARSGEIKPILDQGDFVLDPARNALTSILNLSRSRMIVTSRSTFSMWGAFLGDVPAIWDRRFDRLDYFPERSGRDFMI